MLAATPGCRSKKHSPTDQGRSELVKAERTYSEMTQSKGYKTATLEFLHPDGVIMREGTAPYAGSDAVEYLIALNDSGFAVMRSPTKISVASSADLGYSYGRYQIDQPGMPLSRGSYVTVWQKDEEGNWKIAVESTNFVE